MNAARHADLAVSRIAAAIGEPARCRDAFLPVGRAARTSTELASRGRRQAVDRQRPSESAEVGGTGQGVRAGQAPLLQFGRPGVARALEGLSVLAGGPPRFVPAADALAAAPHLLRPHGGNARRGAA